MNASDKIFKKLPGILAFSRGLVVSDAALFNIDEKGNQTRVNVVRRGIRCTQNINTNGDEGKSAGGAKRQEISNIQTTDSAKLAPDAVAMGVKFSLRFLDLKNALSSCAPGPKDETEEIQALRQSIAGFIKRAQAGRGVQEIARRYARNILNARWLWRNRLIASKIGIVVTVTSESAPLVRIDDALQQPLNHFDNYTEQENRLGKFIAAGISEGALETLHIEARVEFGVNGAMEVFPSQNYLENPPKGFARSLYCVGEKAPFENTEALRVMGQAAIRDQKISNALRTIDTWYADYPATGRPIPVEPNGANLEAQTFFRETKTSAFDMMRRLNAIEPDSDEGMFVTAALIRGGVFSGGK